MNPLSKQQKKISDSYLMNRVINGDCLQVLSDLEDNCLDLTLFSPPYDNIRAYQGKWKFDFTALGKELFRLAKDGSICAVVIGDGTKNFAKSLTSFRLAVEWCDVVGWRLFECCIYRRDGNPGAWWSKRFRVDHEYILLFLKGDKPKTFNKEHIIIASKHAGKIYTGTDRQTDGSLKKITPKAVNPLKCRGTVWDYATSNREGNRLKL